MTGFPSLSLSGLTFFSLTIHTDDDDLSRTGAGLLLNHCCAPWLVLLLSSTLFLSFRARIAPARVLGSSISMFCFCSVFSLMNSLSYSILGLVSCLLGIITCLVETLTIFMSFSFYDSCRLGYPGAFPVELQTLLRDGGGLYRGDLHGGGLHCGDLPDGNLVKCGGL